jgi:hypothetical protein
VVEVVLDSLMCKPEMESPPKAARAEAATQSAKPRAAEVERAAENRLGVEAAAA